MAEPRRIELQQPEISRLAAGVEVFQLDNGMTLAIAEQASPIVATTLWFRFGAADEASDESGVAHFLEHMMFKGSPGFAAGEVDRLTQALGGSNNAFTGHDSTVYHFQFAADRWERALEIEADRMVALSLEPDEVDREREVILEELSMYESDPWDALDVEARSRFFGDHPYGRPVIGTRDSLRSIDADCLRRVHSRAYDPANAVMVIAGPIGAEATARAIDWLGRVPSRRGGVRGAKADSGAAVCSTERVLRSHGETDRLLVILPAPSSNDATHPALRLWTHALSEGRTSRLYRSLVEDSRLCAWVSADLADGVLPGCLTIAAELLPGSEPGIVEERLLGVLDNLAMTPPTTAEVERSRRLFLADWIFAHESSLARALSLGNALSHHDIGFVDRYLTDLMAVDEQRLREVAGTFKTDRALVAWSHAE